MKKSSMSAGLAVGAVAATALSAAGMYLAYTHPRQTKRIMKKAGRTVEKAMGQMENMMAQYF